MLNVLSRETCRGKCDLPSTGSHVPAVNALNIFVDFAPAGFSSNQLQQAVAGAAQLGAQGAAQLGAQLDPQVEPQVEPQQRLRCKRIFGMQILGQRTRQRGLQQLLQPVLQQLATGAQQLGAAGAAQAGAQAGAAQVGAAGAQAGAAHDGAQAAGAAQLGAAEQQLL